MKSSIEVGDDLNPYQSKGAFSLNKKLFNVRLNGINGGPLHSNNEP